MKLKDQRINLSLQVLQRIQDNYSTALGIPISIRNQEGELITKLSQPSKLWALIHSSAEAEKKLVNLLKIAIEKCNRTGQVVIFERHPDTYAFLAPIYVGGEIIAFFIGGLVRFGNPNLEIATEQSAILKIDLDTYLDAYLNLPFFTKERLEASANLIKLIGSTIFNLENQGSENKAKNRLITRKNEELTTQLQESQNLYKRIFDTVNDGIYLADLEQGTFIDINPAGAQLLGYQSPTDLIGKVVRNLYVNPSERDHYLEKLKAQGVISKWPAHIRTPSGEERYFETNASLILDQKTGKQIIQGIFREILPREHRQI
ncbi:PocR ligand-binding domain-containing protein [Candidatus Peregrinibacteria bacterium]|nr:PocR ligand-binding domain-containing protein [Candidatus Peregrinibacteria bacterium]